MRFILSTYIFFILISCTVSSEKVIDMSNNSPTPAGQTFEQVEAEPTPSPIEPEYPGITIDQKFPIISEHGFSDEEKRDKNFDVEALGF